MVAIEPAPVPTSRPFTVFPPAPRDHAGVASFLEDERFGVVYQDARPGRRLDPDHDNNDFVKNAAR
jgi:hypothetical protein